jgi:ATP-binding cassette subfamily B protein
LTVGEVQSFLSYANQYMVPFNQISAVVTQIQTAFASARRVFALLNAQKSSLILLMPKYSPHQR